MKTIWIAISNTPHVLFFNNLIQDLKLKYFIFITYISRGETGQLIKKFDLDAKNMGELKSSSFANILYEGFNTIRYVYSIPKFDFALSLENVAPIPITKFRNKDMILFLDNELKYTSNISFIQNLRNKISLLCDTIVVPKPSYSEFTKIFSNSDIITYNGFKEHINISSYFPDKNFKKDIPFKDYIIIRPESFSSKYVEKKETIIPQLLKEFVKEDINIIYLPRADDEKYGADFNNVYIPPAALNGIDLIYNSRGTLTGSGTMAREAAVLDVPAVSFFPNDDLLSVDQDLVNKKKIFHSRDPIEILDYVLKNWDRIKKPEFKKAIEVKKEIYRIINDKMVN